jgi:hypothetical protein
MEETIGPAVAAMNAERLARPRPADELDFGTPPAAPRVSVVVPLHGRVDFMELQLGLFSARPDPEVELIYVLDDPRRREEAERLAIAAEARFALPFRLILLEEKWGFAPACNEGARRARGDHVCLLNSDVFPLGTEGLGFLAPLRARLDADPKLGAVGPLLLFEDGTVQHQGMHFERVHGLPPWPFPIHDRKAQPPPEGTSLLPAPPSPAPACCCAAPTGTRWAASTRATSSAISRIPTFACASRARPVLRRGPGRAAVPPGAAVAGGGGRLALQRHAGECLAACAALGRAGMSASRVLVVSHTHPRLTTGGAEIAAYEQFRRLGRCRHPGVLPRGQWQLACRAHRRRHPAPLRT